ncbi:MAG: hypothetical protein H6Q06_2096 [Acidobacteria bacterium]|nr:hypothetical protein [Acidobacteriota bacterium]
MDLQDALAPPDIGQRHDDLPVETPRPQECGIQDVGPVARGDENDTVVGLESVHFDEQLVQRLLALVMTAPQPCAAVPPHGIDLVDEDDAGGVLLPLLEEIPHPAGADPHEHLDEIGTADREERDICLACNSAGQQGLPGARRPHQQNAFRNAAPQLLELLRLLEEFDDFGEFFLCLFDSGHIFEGDLFLLAREEPCPALAERERLIPAALHLAHQEQPETDQQDEREP